MVRYGRRQTTTNRPLTRRTTRNPRAKTSPKHATAEQLERLEAETAAREGVEMLRESQLKRAESRFARAHRAMPHIAEYALYLAWSKAEMRATLDDATLDELDRLSTEAARQDSAHGFPPYVSGRVALARGNRETAYRFFKVAERRDPSNRDARELLRRLESERKK